MSLKEPYQTISNKLYELLIDKRCEGRTTWLYLDINGFLHTGIGMNLEPSTPSENTVRLQQQKTTPPINAKPKEMTGKVYDLVWKKGGKLVTNRHIIYQAVWKVRLLGIRDSSIYASGSAKAFEGKTDIEVDVAVIRREFDAGVAMRISVLKRYFSQFDTFPADARLAMLVHSWAMHPRMNSEGILVAGKSQTKWVHYTNAIAARRWWGAQPSADPEERTVAEECHWRGMSEYRYKNMVEMYRQAYKVEENRKKGIAADLDTVHWVKLP